MGLNKQINPMLKVIISIYLYANERLTGKKIEYTVAQFPLSCPYKCIEVWLMALQKLQT